MHKDFEGQNQLIIPVLIAVLVVTFSIVYAFLKLRRAGKRGILITGICDSGKTLIFARLAYEKRVDTYTSVKENLAYYPPGKRFLQLIDVPGHERVRERYLEEYKATCRALIFVIDSNTFQKEIRDVAEYLYNLLTDRTIVNNCKRILILCNKQDAPMAKDSKVIKNLLEKELTTLRDTKTSQLASTDESGKTERVALGAGGSGEGFTFDQLKARVDFAESCATDTDGDGPGLAQLSAWLASVASL